MYPEGSMKVPSVSLLGSVLSLKLEADGLQEKCHAREKP